MNIEVFLVGVSRELQLKGLVWPEGWPIPPEGSTVYTANLETLFVRHVIWYPEGVSGDIEPCIYLVLGSSKATG